MKDIIEFILIVIIIFFVWNSLKRLFYNTFYKFSSPQQNRPQQKPEKEKSKSGKHGLNWDAETVDYEEIKEEK